MRMENRMKILEIGSESVNLVSNNNYTYFGTSFCVGLSQIIINTKTSSLCDWLKPCKSLA